MSKYCIIVSAGSVCEKQRIPQEFRDSYVIACDAGWHNCEKLGIQPDIVLGDFDSSAQPDRENVLVLPREKDDTDTHYAARMAVKMGSTHILMLGALGGKRIEHTFANIGTGLWLERQGIRVTVLDEYSRVTYVLAEEKRNYHNEGYKYFSIFPLEGKAEGICLEGAAYPLQDAQLEVSYPIGVSNEWKADEATIAIQKGSLLVIETYAD